MNLDQEISKYATDLQPLYKLFASKVEELIRSILGAKHITPHSVTSREKTTTSLRQKMTREAKSYEDPLHEITDLAGVRIITFFPKDVDAIVPILEEEFQIDKANSVDKRQSKDPSAFGYASVHLVAQLTKSRSRLPEYEMFKDLKCEIQVRTILQHAWAEIEHDIAYKSNDEIPFQLRRKFASLAGLLEVADREFEMLRHEEGEVRKAIARTITSDNLEIPIDLDSVSLYLKRYHQVASPQSKRVSRLIRLLSSHKIETIGRLHEMLNEKALNEGKLVENRIIKMCPAARECLLPFIVAVGKALNLSEKEIGKVADCPALVDPVGFSEQRRLFSSERNKPQSAKIKKKGAEQSPSANGGHASSAGKSSATEGPPSVS